MGLGKRTETLNQPIKCRPLRFSVRSFQVKRELLKASMSLREEDDEIFSNIYFTPDLTKCQGDEAFKLREERRYRINVLHESNLKISRGQIVKVPEPKDMTSVAVGQSVDVLPVGGT